MKIGIDIGVTNTHAVLVSNQGKLIAAAKQATSSDMLTGLSDAVKHLFEKTRIPPGEVKGIFIGTTEFLKAFFEEKTMAKSALVRIGRRPTKVLPALNWPSSLRSFLQEIFFLETGNRYNGVCQSTNNQEKLKSIFQNIETNSIEAVCIVGAYSPVYEAEETQLKREIKKRFPFVPVTVSHQLGSIGFIERENASLLNTLLSKLIREVFENLNMCFSDLGLTCPLWFTQSNGTLMSVYEAMELPVLTLASGVANSLRGASILSGKKDILAVDVGGSMINIGKVRNGQLKELTSSTSLLGIDASLEIPEFTSLPFGGGSLPSIQNGKLQLFSPKSGDIEKDGLAWGGTSWTVSDSFLKLYPDSFYDQNIDVSRLESLDHSECQQVVRYVVGKIKDALAMLQEPEDEWPIVLVGGGSPLLNEQLFGKYQQVLHPAGYPVSSAIGACFAPVSAVVDKVYWLNNRTKEEVIAEAVDTCKKAVLKKGANPDSIQVSYVKEYPFAYLSGEILRVKTKVTGELIL
ncbi:hydantoinase/oxoprolinase N-terminal domain-containing protein [Bacillota bacterium Lsc_1132]